MDVRLVRLLAEQDGQVARWQLVSLGWSRHAVTHEAQARRWRRVHDGVYSTVHGPLTQRQRWWTAALTAPGTWLNSHSAGAVHGFKAWESDYETVVRAGSGGKRRYPAVLVARSRTLDGVVGWKDGIPVVSPERAMVDLAAELGSWQLGRAFREACRLGCTKPNAIALAVCGQRGTAALAALCDRYAEIPYHRCRSDAESRGLEVLWDAGFVMPRVNWKLRGPRPDFWWPDQRFIIEIDGDQYHQFPDEDARIQAIWEGAGNTVKRVDSQDVYYRPERLIALAHQANVPIVRP